MSEGIEFLERVYEQLHEAGIIRSKGEFSERLLGKSPSYLTSMRAKRRKVPTHIIMGLGDTLLTSLRSNSADPEMCVVLRRNVAQINLYLADQLIPTGVAETITQNQTSSAHRRKTSFQTFLWAKLRRWRRWMRSRGRTKVSS
jgi:hypothetical protein